MIGERVALLAGLLVIPAALLWLGHGFRSHSSRAKRVFWGGVIGHAGGMVLTLIVMMALPVWWHGGSPLRDFAVHWSLLLGAITGMLVGLALRPAAASDDVQPARMRRGSASSSD